MTRTSLYRFYDADGALLYVGITSRGPERWRDHEDHRAWWHRVAASRVEHFEDRLAAAAAERAAIKAEKPPHNVRHAGPPRPSRETRTYRRHGSGTIMQRENGRWVVSIGVGASRRAQFSFGTEADARLVLAALEYRGMASDRARQLASEIVLAGSRWTKAKRNP